MYRMAILAGCVFLMGGCAVGHGPAGDIVLGFKAGSLPETAEQVVMGGAQIAAGAIRDWNSGPLGTILAAGVTAVAGAFGIKGATAAAKARAEAARLQGANEGWEAREQAAAIQAPLPGGVA